MSGLVEENLFGASGSIAAVAGGLSWQPVVTASTVTVVSNNGYFINTTSNACTITLPSSASAGDQIILADYARNWATNAITIDSNGLLFQGETDAFIVDYDTNGQAVNLVYSGATVGWTPASDIVSAFEPVQPPTQRGIYAFGTTGSAVSVSNLVSSSGVVASDTTGVGTARLEPGASSFGGDKAIFAFGQNGDGQSNISNLVSNLGVVASDTDGVGSAREGISAAFGGDKAIFAYGGGTQYWNVSNLVTNVGVVGTDVTGVGTARNALAAACFGGDKAIFGYGTSAGGRQSMTNLVSNTGVVASDVSGVGTARNGLAAAGFGSDRASAIFGYGSTGSSTGITNLVNSSGVVASDVSGVGTARNKPSGLNYGDDKAMFAYGDSGSVTSLKNLVNSSGVVQADVTGVGTARSHLAGAGYSFST